MSALTDLEQKFDGPMPEHALRLRSETPEQFRLRRMAMLRADIAAYAARLAVLKSLRPGDRMPCGSGVPLRQRPVATHESLSVGIAALDCAMANAHEALIEFSRSESDAACDRARDMPVSFFRLAAE